MRRVFALVVILIAVSGYGMVQSAPAQAITIVPTYVQGTQSVPPGGDSLGTISATFVSSVGNGNLVVASATYDDDGSITPSCSDSQGNTFGKRVSYISAINQGLVTCYAANAVGGADTVTVTFNNARPYRGILLAEYAGVAGTSPLDVATTATGFSNGAADGIKSPLATTASDGDLIIGSVYAGDQSGGTGFAQRTATTRLLLEDRVQATAGSTQAIANGTYTDYAVHMLAFRSLGAIESSTTSVTVGPSMSFTVSGRSTQCNGQSALGFQPGSTPTAVPLGHLNSATLTGGAQDLSGSTNGAGGFTVAIRSAGATPDPLRDAGGHTITDVAGTRSSPGSAPTAGTPGFGYTSSDTATAFTSNTWAKLTANNDSVMISSGTGSKNACVGYAAAAGAMTTAGSYAALVVFTAIPTF